MDEQGKPQSGDGPEGSVGGAEGSEPDDAVTTVDLTSGSNQADGSAPARAWGGRIAIAGLAVVLLAGGIVLAREDSETSGAGAPEPLALALGGSNEGAADAALYPGADGGVEYRLEGTLPDLGSDGPVYVLVRPDLSSDDVTDMANALDMAPDSVGSQSDGGWYVEGQNGGSLSLYPQPGSWSVSYSTGDVSVSSSSSPGSTGSGAPDDVDTQARNDVMVEEISPGVTITAVAPPQEGDDIGTDDIGTVDPVDPGYPAEPANLPSEDDAQSIAHDVLDAMGVLDGADWSVSVTEGGIMGYACAEATTTDAAGDEPQAAPDDPAPDPACDGAEHETVLSWNVTFVREVDGVVTSGLEWSVDVGDAGAVDAVYGTLADLEKVDDYPLMSTQAAYDSLVAGDAGVPGDVIPMGTPAVDLPAVGGDVSVDDSGSGSSSGSPGVNDCAAGVDCNDTGFVESEEVVRLRPEECASGIEPGQCVDGYCLDNPAGPGCDEPCTAESLECAPAGVVDARCVDGDGAGIDCTTVTTVPCGDAEPGATGTSCTPTTTLYCPDTEEVPVSGEGPEIGVAPACSAPGCDDPAVDCADPMPTPPPDCDPAAVDCYPPDTYPAPEPVVIVVTGAERTAMVIWGTEDGADVQYLVPTYRMLGHYEADGTDWWTDVVAVEDAFVTQPEPIDDSQTDPPDTAIPPGDPDCSNDDPDACGDPVATTAPPEPGCPPIGDSEYGACATSTSMVPPTSPAPTPTVTMPVTSTSGYPTSTAPPQG